MGRRGTPKRARYPKYNKQKEKKYAMPPPTQQITQHEKNKAIHEKNK